MYSSSQSMNPCFCESINKKNYKKISSLFFFHRIPITFFWDTDDSRLLGCEVRSIQNQKSTKSPSHSMTSTNSSCIGESLINIMFITEKCEIKELETINLNSGQQLINLCAPHAVCNNFLLFFFAFPLNFV